MTTVFVKPGPNPVVLMPERNMARLPDEGALVPLDAYWQARLRDGDVVEAEAPSGDAPAPAPRAKKS